MSTNCNVIAQNYAGNTPLHLSCMQNERKSGIVPQIVFALLTNPFSDPLLPNSQGFTPLMYAVQSEDLGVAKMILSRLTTGKALELLNMAATMLDGVVKRVNAVTLSLKDGVVTDMTRMLMEYGAEPSPNNEKQASLGPELSVLTVPPSKFPSNRLPRIIASNCTRDYTQDEDALNCLKCKVRFGVVTRRVSPLS
jgi:ankyrin repeat protein